MKLNKTTVSLSLLVATILTTGCATRQPATSTTPTPVVNGATDGATTTALDPYASIDQRGGSAAGVTDQNRPYLAKRLVHFDFDSSNISAADYPILQAHAQYLLANSNSKVALIGHTDERGTREYNMALGERRAKSIASYLMSNGVPSTQLETVSYGKEQPLNEGHNEAAWQENRRVEISYEAVPPLLSK